MARVAFNGPMAPYTWYDPTFHMYDYLRRVIIIGGPVIITSDFEISCVEYLLTYGEKIGSTEIQMSLIIDNKKH